MIFPRPTNALDERAQSAESAGVQANARLTGSTGLVLLALIAVEIITLFIKPLNVLPLHVAVGLLMVPVVILKLGSTGWRLVKYCGGVAAYQRKGPPPAPLRLLGPVVAALTILVLATGILLIVGPGSVHSIALSVHKKILYPWLLAVALHLAAHFKDAVRLASRDLFQRVAGSVPGMRYRVAAVLFCTGAGALLAFILTGHSPAYLQQYYPGR